MSCLSELYIYFGCKKVSKCASEASKIDSSDVGEYKQPYHNSRIPATYCMRHFLQHIGWVANHLLEGQRRLFLEVEVCVTQDAFFFCMYLYMTPDANEA